MRVESINKLHGRLDVSMTERCQQLVRDGGPSKCHREPSHMTSLTDDEISRQISRGLGKRLHVTLASTEDHLFA